MMGYHIIPEKELIIEFYGGGPTISEMFEFVGVIKSDKAYNNRFNVLADISEITLTPNMKSIINYIDFLKQTDEVVNTKKMALITNSPQTVVIGTMFMEFSKELPLIINVFSTFETAVHWLDISGFSHKDYLRIVSEIKRANKNKY